MVQWPAGTTVVLGGSVDGDAALSDLVREETGMQQTGLRGGLVGEEVERALRVGQSRDVGRKQGFGILYIWKVVRTLALPLVLLCQPKVVRPRCSTASHDDA